LLPAGGHAAGTTFVPGCNSFWNEFRSHCLLA